MPGADPSVAFVVPRYGPGVVGGAETLCRQLAEHVAAAGTRVEVLTTCATDHFTWTNELPAGDEEVAGVLVRRFPVDEARDHDRFWSLHVAGSLGRRLSYLDQVEWMGSSVWSPGLQDAVEGLDPATWTVAVPYLFGTTYWAVAARPGRTALIPCLHDEPHARLRVVRDALEGAAGCMLNSVGEGELVSRLAPAARTALVGVGFDPDPPPTADAVRAFCARAGVPAGYLLYAGRREAAKGLPLLFSGYAELLRVRPDAPPLALMGSGPLAPPDALRDHVVDLGFVPHEDKAAAYAAASVLVNPSRLESLGMVLMEAWLAGTPSLVNGGSPVLLDHCRASGGGLWFSGPADFAEAAGLLLDSASLRDDLAASGADYTRSSFGWERVVERFRAALDAWGA